MKLEDIDLSKWKVDVLLRDDSDVTYSLYDKPTETIDDRTSQAVDLTDELNEMNSKFENI